jgi:hypothetical protein
MHCPVFGLLWLAQDFGESKADGVEGGSGELGVSVIPDLCRVSLGVYSVEVGLDTAVECQCAIGGNFENTSTYRSWNRPTETAV